MFIFQSLLAADALQQYTLRQGLCDSGSPVVMLENLERNTIFNNQFVLCVTLYALTHLRAGNVIFNITQKQLRYLTLCIFNAVFARYYK